MKNKWLDFLKSYHKNFSTLDYIMIWGGFLLIVLTAAMKQGFPDGLIGGLVFGLFFALITSLRIRNVHNRKVEAQRFSAYIQSNTSKKVVYAVLSYMAIGLLGLLLLGSCLTYSCKNEPVRTQIIFILFGLLIAIPQLFGKERVKGKSDIIALVLLIVLVIYLLGKVFSIW